MLAGLALISGMGQTCADGTPYLTNFGCDDSSAPSCPSGYTLSTESGQYSCTAPNAAPLIGTAAPSAIACPTGATCSIVPGISNANIYFAIAAVASMFLFATAFGGRR